MGEYDPALSAIDFNSLRRAKAKEVVVQATQVLENAPPVSSFCRIAIVREISGSISSLDKTFLTVTQLVKVLGVVPGREHGIFDPKRGIGYEEAFCIARLPVYWQLEAEGKLPENFTNDWIIDLDRRKRTHPYLRWGYPSLSVISTFFGPSGEDTGR